MYTTSSGTSSTHVDSKYTVADILSSMANGELISPSFADPPAVPSFVSSVASMTTPTLTPTSLANIEQTFIELQSVSSTGMSTQAQAQDLTTQSGFVPPIVEPMSAGSSVKEEYDYYDSSSVDEDDSKDWMPSSAKKARISSSALNPVVITPANLGQDPPRKSGRRPKKYDNMTPEEEAKRRLRRERNKLAAAKCRQRRVDHTNLLLNETEKLEDEKASLESDIQTLQQQKEQLEFLLEAHKPMCSQSDKIKVTVTVKSEPSDSRTTSPAPATVSTSSASTSRPNSLPIAAAKSAKPATTTSLTEATGVIISTPSSGMFTTLGFDSIVDGHTGLTPITGAPSCASQVQRNNSDSSSPNEGLSSPTRLVAL